MVGMVMVLLWYLLLGGTVAVVLGVVVYGVCARFNVVERMLCVGLGKALARLAEGGKKGYSVSCGAGGGVKGEKIVVKKEVTDGIHAGGTRMTGLCVDALEFSLPSWRSPLVIKVHGIKVGLLQDWLAMVCYFLL